MISYDNIMKMTLRQHSDNGIMTSYDFDIMSSYGLVWQHFMTVMYDYDIMTSYVFVSYDNFMTLTLWLIIGNSDDL